MKKLLLLAACMAAGATVYGQGKVNFDNQFNTPPNQPITINSSNSAAGEGAVGSFVGANYTASLFYEAGTVVGNVAFDAGSPILYQAADSPFFGVTGTGPGHGPTVDGAGLFQYTGGPGGNSTVTMAGVTGDVSIVIRVWYNGGAATSYAQALALGYNVGESKVFNITLATGNGLVPFLNGLTPFTVQPAPEPATIALGGLGAAALLLFRRRKTA